MLSSAGPSSFLLPVSCTNVLPLVPSWLLRYPKPQLRTTHWNFVEAVDRYFDHLIPRILPLQVINVPAHVHQKEQAAVEHGSRDEGFFRCTLVAG